MATNDVCVAIAAAAQDDPAQALALVRAQWLVSRDETLRDVLLHLDEALVRAYPGPRANGKEEFQEAWLEVARDPSEVVTGWLASTLGRRLPVRELYRWGDMEARYSALFARTEMLRRRCPDPRVAVAVMRLLREGAYGHWIDATIEATYRPLVDLLIEAGDPAMAPVVHDLATNQRSKRSMVRAWQREQLPPVARALERIEAQPLGEVERQVLLPLLPRPAPATTQDVVALFEAVYAEPDDDGIRAVLADALVELGDPRGELMARQLAGDEGPELDRLVRKHGREWIGPDLSATLSSVSWARGFPEEASLKVNHVASDAVWAASYRDERLATLRVLRQGRGNRRHYQAFVTSPATRGLRRIQITTKGLAEALVDAPEKPLEILDWPKRPSRALLQTLANAAVCAAVHTWTFPVNPDLSRLAKAVKGTPWAGQLRSLDIVSDASQSGLVYMRSKVVPGVLERFSTLAAFPELRRVRFSTEYTSLEFQRVPEGWHLHVRSEGLATAWERPFAVYDGGKVISLVPMAAEGSMTTVGGGPVELQMFTPPRDVTGVTLHVDLEATVVSTLEELWDCPVQAAG